LCTPLWERQRRLELDTVVSRHRGVRRVRDGPLPVRVHLRTIPSGCLMGPVQRQRRVQTRAEPLRISYVLERDPAATASSSAWVGIRDDTQTSGSNAGSLSTERAAFDSLLPFSDFP
jgi:hypothetical protein